MKWTHECEPPETRAVSNSGWAPTLPAGRVWYCGCGRPWGSTVDGWVPVPRDEVTTLGIDKQPIDDQVEPGSLEEDLRRQGQKAAKLMDLMRQASEEERRRRENDS